MLVDRDGRAKTALTILIEEVVAAGIQDVGVVVAPGDAAAYRSAAAAGLGGSLEFIEQPAPYGYGHAVWCAREFTGREPFLLLVGDHLSVSDVEESCAAQLVRIAAAENCAVSAVVATHESKLPYYGAVGGRHVGVGGLFDVTTVLEKPTPTVAEQQLVVPGLRAGHYLCFFGMHVLPPSIMDLLGEDVAAAGAAGGVSLSAALARLARRERYRAAELRGRRYDIGEKYGLLTTQLALALDGRDREEVLSNLIGLLAARRH